MNREILVLAGTAAGMGLIHTVIGPDHYIPFIAMSRARRWPMAKTLVISFFAGLGHILSSVILGFVGLAFGLAVAKLENAESVRGGAAAWLLIAFGFVYFIWGLHRAVKNKPHTHAHIHADGETHDHEHGHAAEHGHVHDRPRKANITPWILFTIFIFGPCEPLIPLVMYPAAKHNFSGVVVVTLAFGVTTILTMLTIITASSWGISFVNLGKWERFSHAIAGLMILISGLSVQMLGL
jgi:nickel/cobalt transporter (NicO) family protein